MHRTNTPENVAATGAVQIDAGEGVTLDVPATPPNGDGLAARLAAAEYKSGRRIITSLMREGVGGAANVSRTGDLVVLNLYGIQPPEEVSHDVVDVFAAPLPVGFRPDASLSEPLVIPSATMPPFMPRVFMNAVGACKVNRPGHALYGLVTYRTNDAPPATLPGTPA